MTGREPAAVKGGRLLVEGRVVLELVQADRVRATVFGDTGRYVVEWTPAGDWSCTCPCRTPACSHLAAVRRVVDADLPPEPAHPRPSSSEATR